MIDENSLAQLALDIKQWGIALGFQHVGICDTNLSEHEAHLARWVEKGYFGTMDYMHKHGTKRSRPNELVPGTQRIISVRMDYMTENRDTSWQTIESPAKAFISRYALGRDYHKVMRNRLQKLATQIEARIGKFGYRAFVDSAPVLEKALAEKAGTGWIGKHSNVINDKAGSYFFLGELFTDLPLPVDQPAENHCGSCSKCMEFCPTQAIVAPYEVDGRRCISYLTIENHGDIPEEFRRPMGNRIYGCDDCQLVCPWNKFTELCEEPDFAPRHQLNQATLIDLFSWDEKTFLKNTEGSAIRRIGHEKWQRNLAIGIGNSEASEAALQILREKLPTSSDMVARHITWAINELERKRER